ncbi:hypothetical protein [Rothia nasimurium]|uniref:hypothetical protein n=1 Tax=Rothia nasimurium TaxID=85336 RepID=UPI001F2A3AF7|nr:hypothetical protein [Rothia nasimurium]
MEQYLSQVTPDDAEADELKQYLAENGLYADSVVSDENGFAENVTVDIEPSEESSLPDEEELISLVEDADTAPGQYDAADTHMGKDAVMSYTYEVGDTTVYGSALVLRARNDEGYSYIFCFCSFA